MKKYKKIIIVALCFALLLSMFSVSAFATEEEVNPAASLDSLSNTLWYVPAGWSCEADVFSSELEIINISCSSVSGESSSFNLGFTSDADGNLSAAIDSITFLVDGVVYSLTSEDDFCVSFGDLSSLSDATLLQSFFVENGELLVSSDFFSDFFYEKYYFAPGWIVPNVPLGITSFCSFEAATFSYPFCVLMFSNLFENILLQVYEPEEQIFLTPSDSFVVYFDMDSFTSLEDFDPLEFLNNSCLVYFIKSNAEVLPPPVSESLTNDLFSIFGSVGSWISGAASSLVPMFWDGSSLTFVGILSVSALALSVVFLVLSFIERFLRFGG